MGAGSRGVVSGYGIDVRVCCIRVRSCLGFVVRIRSFSKDKDCHLMGRIVVMVMDRNGAW